MNRSTTTHDDTRERQARPPRPPTPLSRQLVRYIVGFGVGVGRGEASFVVGFTKPNKELCMEVSDAECIELLTFNPAAIESYWGDGRIRLARLSLIFSYLLFTGSFGALVGLVVLRERK